MIKRAEEYLTKMKNVEPWDLRPGALIEEDVKFLKTIFTPEMLGKYLEKNTLKFNIYHIISIFGATVERETLHGS